jgi:hypothetical protein
MGTRMSQGFRWYSYFIFFLSPAFHAPKSRRFETHTIWFVAGPSNAVLIRRTRRTKRIRYNKFTIEKKIKNKYRAPITCGYIIRDDYRRKCAAHNSDGISDPPLALRPWDNFGRTCNSLCCSPEPGRAVHIVVRLTRTCSGQRTVGVLVVRTLDAFRNGRARVNLKTCTMIPGEGAAARKLIIRAIPLYNSTRLKYNIDSKH